MRYETKGAHGLTELTTAGLAREELARAFCQVSSSVRGIAMMEARVLASGVIDRLVKMLVEDDDFMSAILIGVAQRQRRAPPPQRSRGQRE